MSSTAEKRLKNALWFAVGKIVDEQTAQNGMNATPQFIGALVSTVLAQIGEYLPIPSLAICAIYPPACLGPLATAP